MEYVTNGNLRDMLHRQRSAFDMNDLSESSPHASRHRNVNLTVRDLVIFALHIASAMEYVATIQVQPDVYRSV